MRIPVLGSAASVVSAALSHLPKFRLATRTEIASRITTIALPAFVLLSLSSPSQAQAGPLAYLACVGECAALTLGGFLPLCAAACAPLMAAPTP